MADETAKPKRALGRPRKHTSAIDGKAQILSSQGFTDKGLADFFGVSESTVNRWKDDFPLFWESLKTGKKIADSKVEASLYQRAVGYSVPDVHISNFQGDVTITPIIKHFAPDTTAQIFWLKNRQPKKWRDVHTHDVGETLADVLAKFISGNGEKDAGNIIDERKQG